MSRQAPLFVLAALVLLSACGPIRSTAGLVKADRAIAEARAAGASATESYPMILAEALRQKAFEEQGYGEYDRAERLALEAEKEAQEALKFAASIVEPESESPPAESESPPAEPGSPPAESGSPPAESGSSAAESGSPAPQDVPGTDPSASDGDPQGDLSELSK